MASQITSLTIVYSTIYSGADQRKHQSSAPLAFVRGIHRSPVNSSHKWPITRKMFPFGDVTLGIAGLGISHLPLDGYNKGLSWIPLLSGKGDTKINHNNAVSHADRWNPTHCTQTPLTKDLRFIAAAFITHSLRRIFMSWPDCSLTIQMGYIWS